MGRWSKVAVGAIASSPPNFNTRAATCESGCTSPIDNEATTATRRVRSAFCALLALSSISLLAGACGSSANKHATSVPRATFANRMVVVAEPSRVTDASRTAEELALTLGIDVTKVRSILSRNESSVIVARNVGLSAAMRVVKYGLSGIYVLPPWATALVCSHQCDPKLTLNETLQLKTEEVLGQGILSAHAKSGIAIVMEPSSGKILAMSDLDVIQTSHTLTETTTDGAVTQPYQPGSIFKLVTIAAALSARIVQPSTVFTVPNSLNIGGWTFHDAESHPTEHLSVSQILIQSSNVGTIEIANQLGLRRIKSEALALGFGHSTDLGLPRESSGVIDNSPASVSPANLGSLPIGQDDSVTALQLLDMVNAIANRGIFVWPQLTVRSNAPSDPGYSTPSMPPHRVMSAQVALEITKMMVQVVKTGTGVKAVVPGYSVAGKTGTAQIPDYALGAGYLPGAYMATFGGFAPSSHAAISVIVVLDQPTPIFGGDVSAPIFAAIMKFALREFRVHP